MVGYDYGIFTHRKEARKWLKEVVAAIGKKESVLLLAKKLLLVLPNNELPDELVSLIMDAGLFNN